MDKVLNLQHLSGTGTTCIVLEGGDIVTVQELDSFGDSAADQPSVQIEIVGSIDAGIAAARWSPDEELLVVVTKENNVIFMGSTFDPVTEVPLSADDLKASKHVSVGWGKKETQFQGRGARALRDPTIPEKVDQGVPSPHDDGATTISWRGDGAYVAINAVEGAERRVIRVYSREGELDSASEPVDSFESTISWRPSGNLIAGIQRLADRVDVVFFERNGLRHGEFTLKSAEVDVKADTRIRLEWNADSTVLAVSMSETVQLWTMGNYHWYLKQELPLGGSSSNFTWHPEKSLRLAVSSSSAIISAEYVFHAARGSCRPPHDPGAVAVIDGQSVKLTAFRTANIPPPMAQFEISAMSSVVDVAFGPQNTSFAVLHRTGVDIHEWPLKNGRLDKPQPRTSLAFEDVDRGDFSSPLSISCGVDGTFVLTQYSENAGHSHHIVSEAGLQAAKETEGQLVLATSSADDIAATIGQDRSGKLYNLDGVSITALSVDFPSQLPWFEVITLDETQIALGLTRNGNLFANRRHLAKNCTSFVLTPDHLIFTTNNHFVKYVHLLPSVDGKAPPLQFYKRGDQ